MEAYLNTAFKRFLFFVKEFDLVTEKDMRPLKDLIDKYVAWENEKAANRQ